MKFYLIFFLVFLSGCGTTAMNYQAKSMSISEAYDVMDEMVMTQHSNWKPDYFVITDKYLGWDYGSKSSGTVNAVAYNNVVFGSSSSTTKKVGERVYFYKINGVQLYDWKRKFKQWYIVSLIDENGKVIKHVLHTRSLSNAQKTVDALNVILSDRLGIK
ncbi:hypothetical protein [Vibrio aestuarianus]|uniref:hypothetical protein n=1 Tax=Vibrio aestuarianus TaxID=28171 RepID=UPI00237C7B14|nr:hypothetical protein [Vibrio aestuarianus]MDE1334124.1 hypothetical protein [Vibrio aestuarianus]